VLSRRKSASTHTTINVLRVQSFLQCWSHAIQSSLLAILCCQCTSLLNRQCHIMFNIRQRDLLHLTWDRRVRCHLITWPRNRRCPRFPALDQYTRILKAHIWLRHLHQLTVLQKTVMATQMAIKSSRWIPTWARLHQSAIRSLHTGPALHITSSTVVSVKSSTVTPHPSLSMASRIPRTTQTDFAWDS